LSSHQASQNSRKLNLNKHLAGENTWVFSYGQSGKIEAEEKSPSRWLGAFAFKSRNRSKGDD
jgi:hypothetical protein